MPREACVYAVSQVSHAKLIACRCVSFRLWLLSSNSVGDSVADQGVFRERCAVLHLLVGLHAVIDHLDGYLACGLQPQLLDVRAIGDIRT